MYKINSQKHETKNNIKVFSDTKSNVYLLNKIIVLDKNLNLFPPYQLAINIQFAQKKGTFK